VIFGVTVRVDVPDAPGPKLRVVGAAVDVLKSVVFESLGESVNVTVLHPPPTRSLFVTLTVYVVGWPASAFAEAVEALFIFSVGVLVVQAILIVVATGVDVTPAVWPVPAPFAVTVELSVPEIFPDTAFTVSVAVFEPPGLSVRLVGLTVDGVLKSVVSLSLVVSVKVSLAHGPVSLFFTVTV
jgi:hypothetical protein